MEGWTDVTDILRQGVYALCYRGQVVYIGKSKGMLGRIYTHKQMRTKNAPKWLRAHVAGVLFDEVHVMPCHPDRLDSLEREMIERFKPKYNVHHKRNVPLEPITIRIGDRLVTLGSAPSVVPSQPQAEFVRRV